MRISQKCYYAFKAIFELAKHTDSKPLPMTAVAERQGISILFLQTIMRELKQGGFVESKRGKEGGYVLARKPGEITLGEVIRFIDGDPDLVDCGTPRKVTPCDKALFCPFIDVWREASERINKFFDGITFEDMVKKEKEKLYSNVIDYSI